MNRETQLAASRFAEGHSCSQAVFSAFAAALGLEEASALRIASAFGGGIGRRGQVCGAVTGALMALGLARGHADQAEASKAATYHLVDEFLDRFEAAHGSINCRTLIGQAIDTPEGLQAARDAGVFKTICPGLVADAAHTVASLLDTPRQRDEASQ